jgi:hypothetical protein
MKQVLKVMVLPLFIAVMCVLVLPVYAQAAHSVTLTYTASSDAGSSYIVFRAPGACPAAGAALPANFAQIGTNPVGATSFTDTTVVAGTYCYDVEASLGGANSKPSNYTPTIIAPGSVTVTITVSQ